jgi:hypothetical protein
MAKEIYTEIEIHAPARKVWDVLVNFDHYADWNPFIQNISGQLSEGSQLHVTIQPVGGKPMNFKPIVKRIQQHQELRWLGRFLVPGLFDGEHYFRIEEVSEEKVRFIQGEQFRGILVPLLWGSIGSGTEKGFQAMNEALKKKTELK